MEHLPLPDEGILTGRKLDIEVADKVMGLFLVSEEMGSLPVGMVYTPHAFHRYLGSVLQEMKGGSVDVPEVTRHAVPLYSTNEQHAERVVIRMESLGYEMELLEEDHRLGCRFVLPEQNEFWSYGNTRAEAICRAALVAIQRYTWE